MDVREALRTKARDQLNTFTHPKLKAKAVSQLICEHTILGASAFEVNFNKLRETQ